MDFPANTTDFFNGRGAFTDLGITDTELNIAIWSCTHDKKIRYHTYFEERGFECEPRHYKHMLLKKGISFEVEEWKGEWMRKVKKTGNLYLIPGQHQNLCHEAITRFILKGRFPWFDEFSWDIYSGDEIYLKTGSQNEVGRHLYVPVKALLSKDWAAIEQRNRDYFTAYYRTRTNSKGEPYLPMALAAIDSVAAQRLKEKLS